MKKYFFNLTFFAFIFFSFLLKANPLLNDSEELQIVSDNFSETNFTKLDDSLFIKYKKHVTSLFYIARKTDNSKYFLNLANSYTDSILALPKCENNFFAKDFKKTISLTLLTCEENMNHKFSLFPYFSGIPKYLGFVDDPIEYAYDDAIDKLLASRPVAFVLEEANITKSIITRENCDDEMFEIANQVLIKKANHSILPFHKIEELVGKEEATNLINGSLNDSIILMLCNELNIDRLGIFKVNNIDIINESIWLVSSSFQTFINSEGFSDVLLKKGFCVDKRSFSFLYVFIHILFAILLISL